jgi:hypothetical protein
VFARSYRSSPRGPAFSQELNLDSYYYAVTVFSTVGFGDIVPKLNWPKCSPWCR